MLSLLFGYFWVFIFLYFSKTFSKEYLKKSNQNKKEKADSRLLQAM